MTALEQIIDSLKIHISIALLELPPSTGFYAFYTISDDCFDGTDLRHIKKGECVYIGIAKDENLHKRISEAHLKNTGKSTLRRSLGGVLRKKLDLKPTMRGITATKSNISNYTFSEDCEKRLTSYIYKHFEIAFYPYTENNLEDIEKKLIEIFKFPAFNIEYAGNKNPYKKIIKGLRNDCRSIIKNS